MTAAPILAFYDVTRPTRLLTDASRLGLEFILQQKHCGEWKLIQLALVFSLMRRLATLSLSLSFLLWYGATKKCRIFLSGLDTFTVVIDHNPLIPILNSHRLNEIENPRLQRLHTHLLAYNFTARWQKGRGNQARVQGGYGGLRVTPPETNDIHRCFL